MLNAKKLYGFFYSCSRDFFIMRYSYGIYG
nr:MAG TPA: hypothetical protein [Caudoviricetes sp.]